MSGSVIRLIEVGDAETLADLASSNADFLAPFEPSRAVDWATPRRQRVSITALLDQPDVVPFVILDEDGQVAGRITLNTIQRGVAQSAALGYWVDRDHNGHGLATAAVAAAVAHAFDVLDLYRVDAATLVDNIRSQRVLEKNGFQRIGLSPAYLEIAGRRQDHILFTRVR
ncbi:GNAT family N-acetyltransferase [Microbacterium gorillae]|uniref:GNAT family N-acetyltransferase n=1 Tax=Microbacterium gorillae TaxID=1231063 RepID=UPI003D98E8BF